MKNQTTSLPTNFATIASIILMAVPSFFWSGILLAVFFNKPLIIQEVMLPMDQISSILTMMVMIGMPVITLMVNLKAMLQFDYSPQKDNVITHVHLKANAIQIGISIYAVASILMILYFTFFEHFRFYSNNIF